MARHVTRSGDQDLNQNPVYKDKMQGLMEALLPKDFVQIDITFPPYWKADVATGFRAIPLKRDDREGTFSRFHWKNTGPAIDCRRGPVDDGEIITVETGRIFTTAVFAGLPVEKFFGFEMAVLCVDNRKLDPLADGTPRRFWVFETYVSIEAQKLIESRDIEDMRRIAEAQRQADIIAIEEMARINAHRKLGSNIGIPVDLSEPVRARASA